MSIIVVGVGGSQGTIGFSHLNQKSPSSNETFEC